MRLLDITEKPDWRCLNLTGLQPTFGEESIARGYDYLVIPFLSYKWSPSIPGADGQPTIVGASDIEQLSIIPYTYRKLEIRREDVISNLILVGETPSVEFKESAAYDHYRQRVDKSLTDTILKVITSFANSVDGGTLLIGVKDNGELINLRTEEYKAADKQKKNKDGYCLYLNGCIGKGISKFGLSLCSIDVLTIDGADLCVIEIKPSNRPVFCRGLYYSRQGTQDQKFTTEEFYEYIVKQPQHPLA